MGSFFIKQSIGNMRARPIITLVVVLLCAAGLAGSGALRGELDRALDWWESRFTEPLFEVYLDHSLTEEQAQALGVRIAELEQVQRVDFISAAEAQREAEHYLGAIAFSILPENPLPASLRLAIAPDYRNPLNIRLLTDTVITIDGINEIISADQQIAIYARGRQVITDYSTALSIASVGWTVFWLFIGVFLMLRTRATEAKVWRYLGARPGWLRWPPMTEGFILGLCAAGLGWVLSHVISQYIHPTVDMDTPAGLATGSEFVALLIILPIVGSLAGWLAYRMLRKKGAYL